jgi:hypothetical protein
MWWKVGFCVVVVVLAAIVFGKARWESRTRTLRNRLDAARDSSATTLFDVRELELLPPAVQRYFQAALTSERPIVTAVNLEHVGTFNARDKGDAWKHFRSQQRVTTRRPGFVWDARITMIPGVSVHVHDAYVAGEGILHASLLGLVSMVDIRGTSDVAQGELMRFLAEAAWYPTALLPSQGVRWEAIDDRSARATLTDGDASATLTFQFNDDGLIDIIRADARGRSVGNKMVYLPWQGRFWNYQLRDGMRIPIEGEVSWITPEGKRPYWRGRITHVSYPT